MSDMWRGNKMNKLSEKVNKGLFRIKFKPLLKKCGSVEYAEYCYNKYIDQKTNQFYNIEICQKYFWFGVFANIVNQKWGDSKAESIFYSLLTENNINFEFQKKIGKYYADFVINKLVVEVDGPHHWKNKNQVNYDLERDSYIEKQGYIILRVRLYTLVCNIDKIIKIIKALSIKTKAGK